MHHSLSKHGYRETKRKDMTQNVESGDVYLGKVTRIIPIGAFVEFLPGKEGMVHISQLAEGRVDKVEDEVAVGDEVVVKVREIDQRGRFNLTRLGIHPDEAIAVMAKEEVPEAMWEEIDIEVENDNAKLSWDKILKSYYYKLGSVESRHRDVLIAHNDLQWSNEQLQEAIQLAGKIGFKNVSDLPVADLPSSTIFETKPLERSLSKARSKAGDFQNTQIQNKSTLERLEQESQSKISSLESNLRDINKDIDDTTASIEKLKTQKMTEILVIIGTGIVTAVVFPNIIAILVAMGVMWFFRAAS